MYVPEPYEIRDIALIRELIRDYPLATLFSTGSGRPEANHLPLHLHELADGRHVLQGHIARNNPLWTTLSPAVESLAVFHGPDTYISPSWYPTKKETGRVVPTWNYMVVHVHGKLHSIEDPLWLYQHLQRLTAQHEDTLPVPWSIEDAPTDFVEGMIKAVVGIEMSITLLRGKSKISQGQTLQNKIGVIQGLRARQKHFDVLMAEWIASHCREPTPPF